MPKSAPSKPLLTTKPYGALQTTVNKGGHPPKPSPTNTVALRSHHRPPSLICPLASSSFAVLLILSTRSPPHLLAHPHPMYFPPPPVFKHHKSMPLNAPFTVPSAPTSNTYTHILQLWSLLSPAPGPKPNLYTGQEGGLGCFRR
ncbi:hypothetical protein L198_08250 [Cryptococcus wingfieldii CBS 7118]|uniref:Uncharacterized protein n=1 Tax=Cryptococcus wingfieldii CBS 7118 TaxID=1295528 RepID=A0A1E3HD48_9TREE|nr:hypothetical protein L198_08250 [Cryptococcus wingfieldii CBS 7118]ODN74254.1 hypothetical protein L198_08250 [Cryptococcus wingfieldii CBS 7118]